MTSRSNASDLPLLFDANKLKYNSLFIGLYAISVVVLFAGVHSPMVFMLHWYDVGLSKAVDTGLFPKYAAEYLTSNKDIIFSNFVIPLKTLFFFAALLVVIYPLCKTISAYRSRILNKWVNKKIILSVLSSFGILCLLVFPWRLAAYGEMSFDPFGYRDNKMWYYQRILSTALSYFLQMKGPVLYLTFSLFCTVLLLWIIYLFFLERNIVLSRIELISLGTSSFIVSQLYLPGHPEQLVYALMLSLFIMPTDSFSRLSVVVLCILTHEISIVPISFLALLYFTKEEKIKTGIIIALYGFFWLLSFGMNVSALLAVRDVDGGNGLTWMVQFPFREILGIAISIKLLWIVVGYTVLKKSEDRITIVSFIAIALLFTALGVDTSRLMGYSIVAVVLSYYWTRKEQLIHPQVLRYVIVGNLLLPSFYICTHVGVLFVNGIFPYGEDGRLLMANGLYQIFYMGLM